MTTILHIAIPTPLYSFFDYLAPKNCVKEKLIPGVRVKVPWRRGEIVGILLSVSNKTTVPKDKLKEATEVLDDKPLFSKTIFELLQFAADYYHYPMGEVFAAGLPTLLRQGRAAEYHKFSPYEALPEVMPLLALSDAQQQAVHQISESLNHFQPFLLDGVTGSGKTEIYLQVIAQVLAQKKQALVLVPEIGLTPQTVTRFQQRFPVNIAVLHSGLTDRQRHDAWLQACLGDAAIVIGTRSAIFTPLKNPGIIVVDEEHDMSFKQQDGFHYSARDLAIVRAQLEKIPVVLGSATPSLESLHNVKLNRYKLLTLPERAGSSVHPTMKVVDLRAQNLQHGLSLSLIEHIREHIAQKNQVLLFLNRRGYAPTLMCHECGYVVTCKRCDVRLTLHQLPPHLQCHHCGSSRAVDKKCEQCSAAKLVPVGVGTERIEDALTKMFPGVTMVRVDRDSTRKKGSLENKLTQIHSGESCILIGTQMLAKGHHFPDVTLAAIIDIDGGLLSADFRGTERTAQLIMQVAGRAGRVEKPGTMILQTHHPEHPLLQHLLKEGYASFAQAALCEREQALLPPYQFWVLISSEAMKQELPLQFLRAIKEAMQHQANGVMMLGPVMAPMAKRAGKHRAQLLLQASNRKALKGYLNLLIVHMATLKTKQQVRWSIDVDPLEMF